MRGTAITVGAVPVRDTGAAQKAPHWSVNAFLYFLVFTLNLGNNFRFLEVKTFFYLYLDLDKEFMKGPKRDVCAGTPTGQL